MNNFPSNDMHEAVSALTGVKINKLNIEKQKGRLIFMCDNVVDGNALSGIE